jgi:phage gp29-like protein
VAKIFGWNITRSAPKIRAVGTEFETRSLQNIVKAGAGRTIADGERFANLPAVRHTSEVITGNDSDISGRAVLNDPREAYWSILPNKIQPKQAQWMLRAAAGGDLWQQWRLLAAMTDTWPKYAMAMHQLREAVSYVKYGVHAFTEEGQDPTPSAVDRRNLVSRALATMSPNPFNDEKRQAGMIYNFTDAVGMGIAMEEIIWRDPARAPGGKWERLPKATAWTHPRHFSFNQNGEAIIFANAMSLEVGDYRRYGKGIGEIPNPNKMICSQFMSLSGTSLTSGLGRRLVWWWCARQFGLDFVLRNASVFGATYVDFTFSPGCLVTEREALLSAVQKGMANRVIGHPHGTELKLVNPANLSPENPQRWLIEESDREVLYLLLGQTGSTISAPGKLGGEDTHNDVKQERVSGVAEWVSQNPLDQFARAVLRVNYGDEEECPSFKPDFTKPLNAAEVGTLCTAISSSKVPVKTTEFYQKTGFTTPQEGEPVIQAGEIKIMGKPLTDDEKHEQDLQRQMEIAEAQQELAGGGGGGDDQRPGQPAKARQPMSGLNYRRLLVTASDADLIELETLVTAVETAPHKNGEYLLLQNKLKSINSNRR